MSVTVNGDVIINIQYEDEEDNVSLPERSVKSIRSNKAMKTFKKTVKSRDGKCICCGSTDKKLEAHHLFRVSEYSDLAFEVANGVSLCHACHEKYHKEYQDDVNPVSFVELIRRFSNRRFV